MNTSAMTISEHQVVILDRPYTLAQYADQPDVGLLGEITRVVSLRLGRLLEAGYDDARDIMAAAVVPDLDDGEWWVDDFNALCPDPRGNGQTLFSVSLAPGVNADGNGHTAITWLEYLHAHVTTTC